MFKKIRINTEEWQENANQSIYTYIYLFFKHIIFVIYIHLRSIDFAFCDPQFLNNRCRPSFKLFLLKFRFVFRPQVTVQKLVFVTPQKVFLPKLIWNVQVFYVNFYGGMFSQPKFKLDYYSSKPSNNAAIYVRQKVTEEKS